MSLLLWCKKITLALLVDIGGNDDCKTIPICEMDCYMRGPSYRCNRRGIQEVPSFPESTQDLYVAIVLSKTVIHHNFSHFNNLSWYIVIN